MGIRLGIGGLKIGQGSTGINWSSYWTTPEYEAWLAAMTVVPSDADKLIQMKFVKAFVDSGLFAKAEFFDMFAAPDGAQNINIINPGTFDPAPVNAPAFTAYEGYQGNAAGGKCVRLHFNPTTDGTLVAQDNICAIIGIGDSVDENLYDFGGGAGASCYFLLKSKNGVTAATFCNNTTEGNTVAANIKNIYGMSRGAGASFNHLVGLKYSNIATASTALVNFELYACGWNSNGTITPNNRQTRFAGVFSYLTKIEMRKLVGIIEEYLDNYNKRILNYVNGYSVISTKQLITAPTSIVGNDEVIHPSIVDCGAAWNGYRYWQANTPYPGSDSEYELPEIYASNDCVNWVVPAGMVNPIYARIPGSHLYADVDLYFESNKLYLTYVFRTDMSIRMIESSNGITWSTGAEKELFDDATTSPASQCLVKIGATYYLYYVGATGVSSNIKRVSCATIDGTYGTVEDVLVNVTFGAWHMGMFQVGSDIYIIAGDGTQTDQPFYLLKSADGINFTRDADELPIIAPTETWESSGSYKPTVVLIGTDYWCYYSAIGATGNYMGRVKIKLI